MKQNYFLVLIAILTGPYLAAQSYFQQEVNYNITVKLDDVNHTLQANESIEYINRSPNTLTFIYMHVWPNAYKDNTTPLAKQLYDHGDTKLYYATAEERGYIDELDFKVNDQSVKWELLKDSIDICKIYLNSPLSPNEKIVIATPFHVKIPSGEISRLGHIGQAYAISQWYPKPAVYDQNGWNYMPYLNQGEFYSEFGSFDVSITLPKNYVLGATGDMVNGEEETEWLTKKANEINDSTVFDKSDMHFPTSDSQTKTLRFKQSNVHDFAWFCDKRYHVMKGEIETPHTKHKVTTWAFFTNAEAYLWKKSISYINDAIYYYSLWNGDYPYNQCTAVDGTISAGGGMEYPNITIIGTSSNDFSLDEVIAHEVGHNWFYGMLGSNEREHAWMDEGINSFYELRYLEIKYPDMRLIDHILGGKNIKFLDLARYKYRSEIYLAYLFSASTNDDQPIETPSYDFTETNYGTCVYEKSALVFNYLMTHMGEKKLDEAMQQYFNEWHFKHPQPKDLRKILEDAYGKDLNWFFNDLIGTSKKLDYKIAFAHQNADKTWDLGVKNNGGVSSPLFIQGIKDNKLVGEINFTGFKGKQVLIFPASEVDYFKIDFAEDMPEINRKNNTIRTKGMFKTVEPLKFQLLGSLNNPSRTQLFWSPALGYNNYNKFMLGAAFYNSIIPRKNFEFELMPLYSFGTNDLNGYAHATCTHYFDKGIHSLQFGFTGARYALNTDPFDMSFNKIAPEVSIAFNKKSACISHTLTYRNISIIRDGVQSKFENNQTNYSRIQVITNFNDLTYNLTKRDVISPYSASVNVQQGEQMCKTSLTLKYAYHFKKKNKGVNIRLFAGTFIGTSATNAGPYRFRLSGLTGSQDYLYDHIFLGRTETQGVFSQQFAEADGGFKFYSPLGQSSKWLTALNIKSSLGNMKLPLLLYADIGTCSKDALTSEDVLYDAGVCLSIKKDVFEVYFPILISQNFKDYNKANDLSYGETIRFMLHLNLVNPFYLIRNLSL
ncbi:MAG TPA: M1 family metallopeptidase [Bacteroidia bacterium]|jgi:hypothetical protein|nr:M1 family metallopeptidase [Bacteroidia bacterium]